MLNAGCKSVACNEPRQMSSLWGCSSTNPEGREKAAHCPLPDGCNKRIHRYPPQPESALTPRLSRDAGPITDRHGPGTAFRLRLVLHAPRPPPTVNTIHQRRCTSSRSGIGTGAGRRGLSASRTFSRSSCRWSASVRCALRFIAKSFALFDRLTYPDFTLNPLARPLKTP